MGPVAWVAASHPAETTRHTAALALTALPPVPEAGLERIDSALDGLKGPWKRYARKAELRGALADADPQIGQSNAGLPPWDRLGIWFWRFWRRVFHDWQRILLLTLGGGLGAGIGLGLLRALVVFFTLGQKESCQLPVDVQLSGLPGRGGAMPRHAPGRTCAPQTDAQAGRTESRVAGMEGPGPGCHSRRPLLWAEPL